MLSFFYLFLLGLNAVCIATMLNKCKNKKQRLAFHWILACVENLPAGLLLLAVYPVTSLLHSNIETLASIPLLVGMGAHTP